MINDHSENSSVIFHIKMAFRELPEVLIPQDCFRTREHWLDNEISDESDIEGANYFVYVFGGWDWTTNSIPDINRIVLLHQLLHYAKNPNVVFADIVNEID